MPPPRLVIVRRFHPGAKLGRILCSSAHRSLSILLAVRWWSPYRDAGDRSDHEDQTIHPRARSGGLRHHHDHDQQQRAGQEFANARPGDVWINFVEAQDLHREPRRLPQNSRTQESYAAALRAPRPLCGMPRSDGARRSRVSALRPPTSRRRWSVNLLQRQLRRRIFTAGRKSGMIVISARGAKR